MQISQKTIARELGLSQQAVSKALRGEVDISEKVRDKVTQFAHRNGYRSNRLARSLVEGKTHIIGLLYPSFSGPYFTNLLNSIESELITHGYQLLIRHWSNMFQDDRNDIESLLQYKVDGLIVCPRSNKSWDKTVYPELAKNGIQIVSLTNLILGTEIPCVTSDNHNGAKSIVDLLIENGHRHIAYVGPITQIYTNDQQERMAGYRQSLENAGIPFSENNLIDSNTKDFFGSIKTFMKEKPKTTAFFCFQDKLAVDVISSMRKLGYSVPEEISVTGFGNNLLYPEEMKVPLTTVSQNENEIGKTVVRNLIKILNHKTVSKHEKISTSLIIRDSITNISRGKIT